VYYDQAANPVLRRSRRFGDARGLVARRSQQQVAKRRRAHRNGASSRTATSRSLPLRLSVHRKEVVWGPLESFSHRVVAGIDRDPVGQRYRGRPARIDGFRILQTAGSRVVRATGSSAAGFQRRLQTSEPGPVGGRGIGQHLHRQGDVIDDEPAVDQRVGIAGPASFRRRSVGGRQ
jgi:hypothetical protein